MRRIASAFIVTVALTSSSASAQFVDSFVDHLKNSRPQTIHTIIELDYFPSVEDAQFGLPVVRFDMNFIDYDDDERAVGQAYYHSTWGNAFGYGGPGIISFEEFITAGLSYKPHEKLAGSVTWEPIGIYVNPAGGIFGSGLTLQLAVPLVVLELNERAQGMATGFITQKDTNMRMRNLKVRLNPTPGVYVSVTRQGIGMTDGPITSFAVGVGF